MNLKGQRSKTKEVTASKDQRKLRKLKKPKKAIKVKEG